MRAPHLLLIGLCLLLCQCAGYHLGGSKPAQLAEVEKLYVPSFKNRTLTPRAQVMLTNSVIDQLTRDGTYQVVEKAKADAILRGTIQTIDYSPLRFNRSDSLRPQEVTQRMLVNYEVVDSATGEPLLRDTLRASTNPFVEENFQTTRTSALPDVCRRAAINLVNQITHGL